MSQPQAATPPPPKPKPTAAISEIPPPSSSSSPTTPYTIFRRLQKATGFEKPSNLWLFIFFPCIFSIYCIRSLPKLDYENGWAKSITSGEWYWFSKGIERVAMQMHLWSVIPAGVLMPLQFLPVIRRRYINLHRLSGYFLLCLLMSGNFSALIISRHAFGGTIATQTGVISLAIQTTFGLAKGINAIRNLCIDEHRMWMMRTWALAASILTVRVFSGIRVISSLLGILNGHKVVSTCDELLFMYERESRPLDLVCSAYPACQNFNPATSTSPIYVITNATFDLSRPETIAAVLGTAFGASVWASQVIHLIGVQWYLGYSKGEDERLRKVSLAKRKAMGMEKLAEKER